MPFYPAQIKAYLPLIGKTISEAELHDKTGVTIMACKQKGGVLAQINEGSSTWKQT